MLSREMEECKPLKAGNQNSRFAHQLMNYACLYTSHARNLVAGAYTRPLLTST